MKKPIFVLALTFSLAFAAPAQTRSGGTVAGQVFAEDKTQSLAGARVRLLRFGVVLEETRTSGLGVFEFRATGEGRYTVEAEAQCATALDDLGKVGRGRGIIQGRTQKSVF